MKISQIAALLALTFAGSAFAAESGALNAGSVIVSNNTLTAGTASSGGSVSVGRFNDSTKVLTGATVTVTPDQETLEATRGSGSGNVNASAYANNSFSLGGISGNANSGTATFTNISGSGASQNVTWSAYSNSATTNAQLNNFWGSGNVTGSVAETLYLQRTSGSRSVSLNDRSTDNATVVASYTSANHATGSFNSNSVLNSSLDLTFASVATGTASANQTFSLYNLLNSFGMQVVSITNTQNTGGAFGLSGITTGGNLAAGAKMDGSVSFASASAAAGNYTGSWTIRVADTADTGVLGVGRNTTNTGELTLTVHGVVTAVPEPESYAMLIAGLGLIGAIATRRRKGFKA